MILKRIASHCIDETDGLFITLPEDDLSYQQVFVDSCRNAGIGAEIIDPDLARRLEPSVNPDLIGAVRVPDGSVDLSVRGTEDTVEIEVADTGIGIPEEDRLNIFDRFYRVDKARSRATGGNGLGLSIVHDAVQAHGGSVAVGQNKPQGSRFIVTLPRAKEEETGI